MTDVVMPQMGESIVEGTLTRWLKKVGEKVERDEPLFEISTDKVDTEIPSPVAGMLAEIVVQEGNTVGINTVVGRIGEARRDGSCSGEPQAAEPVKESAPAPVPTPIPATSQPRNRRRRSVAFQAASATGVPALHRRRVHTQPRRGPLPSLHSEEESESGPLSPLVRKMAREYNIDLSRVRGTGAGGRITKQDVESYMASQGARTVSQAAAPAPACRTQRFQRASSTAPRGSRQDPHRAHVDDAQEDRRAHGHLASILLRMSPPFTGST